jgi:putative tricarboxylic transport membrane protein
MSESIEEAGGTGPSHRGVELGVAGAIALLALIGIYGSLKNGVGWASDGPQAGFFPFYVCLIILVSCAVNVTQVLMSSNDGHVFAYWSQLGKVGSVLLPTIIYVLVIPYSGIYVASGVLIAFFMRRFGRYSWLMAIAIGVLVPVLCFFMLEIWFLVPLPKGPLESMLGY